MFRQTIGDKMNSRVVKKKLHISFIASQNVLDYIGGIRSFTLSALRWLSEKNVKVSLIYREKVLAEVLQDFAYSKPEKTRLDSKNGRGSSNSRTYRMPSYFMYLTMQLLFCLLAIATILKLNKRQRISVLHAQDT